MGAIFQAVLGYIFLFSDLDFLKKYREDFLEKNARNISLFLVFVLIGSLMDICNIVKTFYPNLNCELLFA